MKKHLIVFTLLLFLIATHTTAQEEDSNLAEEETQTQGIQPQHTSITAEDGLPLFGDYYVPQQAGSPTVLLLHQMYTNRASWSPLLPALVGNGFRVLSVDVRGYGETGGAINWEQAHHDTLQWLDWLYGQPGVHLDSVFIIGSSMGATLALNGCTDANLCAGVIAISPGRSYYGFSTDRAITSGKATLIVYASRDRYPSREVPQMLALAEENGTETSITITTYPGRAHGIDLFAQYDELIPHLINWISQHIP